MKGLHWDFAPARIFFLVFRALEREIVLDGLAGKASFIIFARREA